VRGASSEFDSRPEGVVRAVGGHLLALARGHRPGPKAEAKAVWAGGGEVPQVVGAIPEDLPRPRGSGCKTIRVWCPDRTPPRRILETSAFGLPTAWLPGRVAAGRTWCEAGTGRVEVKQPTRQVGCRSLPQAGQGWGRPGRSRRSAGGPVPVNGGTRENRLARTSADVRTVVPTIQGWAVALLFFVAAAGATKLVWGLLQAGNPGRAAVVVALGGAFAVVARVAGLMILTDRTRFDRAAGRAVRRKLGGTVWSVDLREVLAVQCLYAGQEWTKSGWVRQYQVNLVLQAAEDRRVPGCGEGGDPGWGVALGRDLAEFLGVPVVDQTSPAAEAVPSEGQTG